MGRADIAVCDYPEDLKQVLRLMPAPVAIISSSDGEGRPVGLAVSALMPVSLDPCSVAIALNRSGSAHCHILDTGEFCVNLLGKEQVGEFVPFADFQRKDERFASDAWKSHQGIPYLAGAPANMFCRIEAVCSYGTHDIVIGKVFDLRSSNCPSSLGWCNGALGHMVPV